MSIIIICILQSVQILPIILFLPISLSLEQPLAPEEEITICGISHPPLDLLHNNIVAINASIDEQFFLGNGSDGLDSKSLVHLFDLESENYITSLPDDGIQIEPIQHTSHYILGFHSPAHDGFGLVEVNLIVLSNPYTTLGLQIFLSLWRMLMGGM